MQRYGNDDGIRDFTFDILEHIGVIEVKKNGWRRELNIVRWNNAEAPKFDIRDWDSTHTKMTRGITMYAYEMNALTDLYRSYKEVKSKQAREEAAAFIESGAFDLQQESAATEAFASATESVNRFVPPAAAASAAAPAPF